MRHLLAFLALVALLISPVTAAAAQRTCDQMGPEAMAGMTMPMAAARGAAPAAQDPCCDHGQKAPDKKTCAEACAAMCGVAVTLPDASIAYPVIFVASTYAARRQIVRAHSPPRAERPPRSIA
jgi:uncharacterized iron-regulated membrane protein